MLAITLRLFLHDSRNPWYVGGYLSVNTWRIYPGTPVAIGDHSSEHSIAGSIMPLTEVSQWCSAISPEKMQKRRDVKIKRKNGRYRVDGMVKPVQQRKLETERN